MRVDISLLPALAAAFMLVFARIGAMVMLLPGLGESNIPVRIKLGIALVLTLVILPLHRAAYQIDLQSLAPLLVLMVHEIVIGIVLGATARVTLAALQVAGSVIAQQLGLGFVTAVDPTQGQQALHFADVDHAGKARFPQPLLQDRGTDRAFVDNHDLRRRLGAHYSLAFRQTIHSTPEIRLKPCNYGQLGLAPAHQLVRWI